MTFLILPLDAELAPSICTWAIHKQMLAMYSVSRLADLCLVWAITQLWYLVQMSQVKIFSALLIHAQLLSSYKVEKKKKRWPLGTNLIATNVIFIAKLSKLESRTLYIPKANNFFHRATWRTIWPILLVHRFRMI